MHTNWSAELQPENPKTLRQVIIVSMEDQNGQTNEILQKAVKMDTTNTKHKKKNKGKGFSLSKKKKAEEGVTHNI